MPQSSCKRLSLTTKMNLSKLVAFRAGSLSQELSVGPNGASALGSTHAPMLLLYEDLTHRPSSQQNHPPVLWLSLSEAILVQQLVNGA